LNLVAIVWLTGALVQLYEGAPLPWLEEAAPVEAALAEAPASPSPAGVPAAPAAPLSVEQILALQLPLPNPERVQEQVPPVAPAEAQRLVCLSEGDYPPFNYQEGDGGLAGFDVELARALCDRLEAECGFVLRP